MILLTLFDKTLAIEIKYLFGSKKEKLYNTGECMQLFDVVSAEKIIALCARGYQLAASTKNSMHSIFTCVYVYSKRKLIFTMGTVLHLSYADNYRNIFHILPTGLEFLANANKN